MTIEQVTDSFDRVDQPVDEVAFCGQTRSILRARDHRLFWQRLAVAAVGSHNGTAHRPHRLFTVSPVLTIFVALIAVGGGIGLTVWMYAAAGRVVREQWRERRYRKNEGPDRAR